MDFIVLIGGGNKVIDVLALLTTLSNFIEGDYEFLLLLVFHLKGEFRL